MIKVILISQFPLPFDKIGSWTTMYKNYLEDQHEIDYIVCEQPLKKKFDINYSFLNKTIYTKILKKYTKNPYLEYINALLKIIKSDEKYIIQVVDNFGIITHLQKALTKNNLRQNCYVQFFYHGYAPFVKNLDQSWFFDYVDEMILLTYKSYHEHKNYYTSLPIKFNVLHNGINTSKFFKLTINEKLELRKTNNLENVKVFIWCSQDRPKKGLKIILDAWKFIEQKYDNVQLWIIGTVKKVDTKSIKYFGKIENDLLPNYFQMSDVYLFPSLWQEGFGMSLIEALHCGNYCIASDNGGISEVLENGKFGKLVKNPNIVEDWVFAIEEYMEQPLKFDILPLQKYSQIEWNAKMNKIIFDAKHLF